jgi:branched-chain amino acid aminotransferase
MPQQFNEGNRDLIVNVNSRLVHRDQAAVSPFSSSVQGGDAVWEGLRLYDGRIVKLTEHLDRLRSSALALAFHQIRSHDSIGDSKPGLVSRRIGELYRKRTQRQGVRVVD